MENKLNEKLYNLYDVKNREDYTGSIKKCECTIKGERGLFKERISTQSKDHIMEQVAYEIAKLLGVNCCKAYCRKTEDLYGSFSRFEVRDLGNVISYESLIGASELFAEEIIKRTIELTHNNINNFVVGLYKYLIFDYIMGQHDRHLENLAVYKKSNNVIVWYPLYDNGLCCFSSYSNDTAIKCLGNGFYSSRMGSSEDIFNAICKYRQVIFPDDLRKIVRYHNIKYDTIMNIIDIADKYNQLGMKRREATARFIIRQTMDIHRLNIGNVEY